MMRRSLPFVFILCLLAGYLSAQTQLNLIPQPVEVQIQKGRFRLLSSATIGYGDLSARPEAEMLAARLRVATRFRLPTAATGVIQLRLNSKPDARLGNEGYTLQVSAQGIRITANQRAGLFYGAQTLLQLFPKEVESQKPLRANWTIPAVQIMDYPRFGWRGLMLDVSRHFFKKEDVKRYIDRMAQYKYNTLHWHLTDDQGWRVEIKSRPRLTQIGACRVPRFGKWGEYEAPKPGEAATDCGFYTQEDVREIVAYARERHIVVLPEIDVPGHSMAAIASYPELACTRDSNARVNPGSDFSEWYGNGKFKMFIDNSLNPSDERVYAFLDNVFGEIAALFPHPYIHVGGDECYKGYWENDPGCKALMQTLGLKDGMELQSYFMKRVEKIVQSKGKKLIGWDEILEGGLPEEAAVMSWQGAKGGIEAARLGHDVVMTPNDDTYIDLIQGDPAVEPDATSYKTVRLRRAFDFEPVPEGVDPKRILGGQANLWSEKIPTIRHAEYMTWPRAWALADVYWSPKAPRDWGRFVVRMEHHMERSDVAGTNYARSAYDAVVKPSLVNNRLYVEMSAEVDGLDLFYTLDETLPDTFTQRWTGQPIEIPEGPVTLKTITYREGKPVGKLVVLSRADLLKRVGK